VRRAGLTLAALLLCCGCGNRRPGALPTARSPGSTDFFVPLRKEVTAEVARGLGELGRRDPSGAQAALARALRLDPAFDAARYAYAVALTERGRLGAALAELAVVIGHDPVHFGPLAMHDEHLQPLRKDLRLAHLVRAARAAFARRARVPGLRFVARLPSQAEARAGSREDIYQLDLTTGRYLRLTDAGTQGVIGNLASSPDGRWLVYTRHRLARRRDPLRELVLIAVDLATGVQHAPVAVPWATHEVQLGWDPAGHFWGETRTELNAIAEENWSDYEIDRQEEYATRRFTFDPEGGLLPERVSKAPPQSGLLLRWLSRTTLPPPASAVAEPAPGVWFQGTELRLPAGRLLTLPDRGADAALSPDGRWLAFSLDRDACDLAPSVGDQDNVLYLLDLRALALRPIARGRHLYHKVWIDARNLVYEVGSDPAAMRLRVHRIGHPDDLAIGPESPAALAPLPHTANCVSDSD